jgi:hypothetical protein
MPLRVCSALALLGAGLWLLPAGAAFAQGAPPAVAVSVDPCVPVNRAKLHELLAIELGTSTVGGPSPNALTQVSVSCRPEGIELQLADGVTRKSMSRILPASSFVDASRTRLLALAIAEFVVASWIELRAQPKPVVEPVGPPPPPAARELAAQVVADRAQDPLPARLDSSLSVGMALSVWSSHDAVLIGAAARLIMPILPALAWTISADAEVADADVRLGSVSVTTASAALALTLHADLSALAVFTGPGGRFGVAYLDGQPDDRAHVRVDPFLAPYGGPIWLLRIEYQATTRLRLALEAEGGLSTLPVRAEVQGGVQLFDLSESWFSSTLAAGIAF